MDKLNINRGKGNIIMKPVLISLLQIFILIPAVMAVQTKIYWSNFGGDKIQRADLDGSNVKDIIFINEPEGIALDVKNNHIYYTNTANASPVNAKVFRADLNGLNPHTLISNLHVPRGIALDLVNEKIYFGQSGGGTDRIQRANLNGSRVETLLIAPNNDIALHLRTGKMYWVDGRDVIKADLDGTDTEIVASEFDWPLGIAIDPLHGKIYITDARAGKILRMNLDGGEIEELVTNLNYTSGIALDLKEEKMYWAIWGNVNKIMRSNLDGTDVENIVTEDLLFPRYISLSIEPDTDLDGVPDSKDFCPATAQETSASKRLLNNRFADIDNDGTFETFQQRTIVNSEYNLADTHGCTCAQILANQRGNRINELMFGCKEKTITSWVHQAETN